MVAGAVAAKSNFADERPEETPKLGPFVYVLAASAVIGGFIFGYDTSIVSAAMLYVPLNKGMEPVTSVWHETIVSITSGMAVFGSLLSGQTSDRFGRRKTILAASFVFTIGAVICGIAWNKIILLIGRILLGAAIGFTSMVVPVYVGEASPSHIRGSMMTLFHTMIAFGQVVANLVGGVFSYIDPVNFGWRMMFALAGVPAVIQFICFIFLPESPRWLYEHDEQDEAREVLQKVYGTHKDWIDYELMEIKYTVDQEKRAKESNGNQSTMSRIVTTPHVLKALFIGSALQMFQQLTGINSVMYYTGNIIRSAGIKNDHTSIWISAATTSLNFFGTAIPAIYIERIGRRKMFLLSIAGVFITLLALGVSFRLINQDSAFNFSSDDYRLDTTYNSSVYDAARCYCLPFPRGTTSGLASTGACSTEQFMHSNGSNFEWEDGYCKTRYTMLPIIIIVFYLLSYSIGFGPIPWVVNSEIFPLWARSTCVSISTSTTWVFNLIVSLTFLTLNEALTKYGTFFLYCGFTLISGIFVYFFLPETKGYSIEEVEVLFMSDKAKSAVLEKNDRNDEKDRAPTYKSME